MEISPELIAALQALQSQAKSNDSVSVGFSRGLLENVLTNLNGKPATLIRGDYHSSACALITSGGKKSTVEQANAWLGQLSEMAQAEMAVLDLSLVMDHKTLAKIIKQMVKEGMTYAIVTFSAVPGIHKRLAKSKATGEVITALTVDMYDKETIVVTVASNPMMLSAFYSEDDDQWMTAVANSAIAKRKGVDNWKATQAESGEKTEGTIEPSEDNLDLLEDEAVATTIV